MIRILAAMAFGTMVSTAALAGWELDPDNSSLSFVSTKANVAAEVHHFRSLQGKLSDTGEAQLQISLASVDTAIEIRDERMRDVLFETAQYPHATVTTKIDADAIDSLPVGASMPLTAEAMLALRGIETAVTFNALVARLAEDRLLVTSTAPLVVNAAQVNLLDGVEKLREIAGLPSISPAVPVTFVLTFERN